MEAKKIMNKITMADVRELKAQGLSSDDIAVKLGTTRERIRQVWDRIKRRDKAISEGYQLDKNGRFIRKGIEPKAPPASSNQPL